MIAYQSNNAMNQLLNQRNLKKKIVKFLIQTKIKILISSKNNNN